MIALIKSEEIKLKRNQIIAYVSFVLIFLLMVTIAVSQPRVSNNKYDPNIFGIAWYALFILAGIGFALTLGIFEFKRFKKDPEILYEGLLIFVPLAIIGARIWYVIFNPGTPIIPSNFRLAGLAIHGGIIATFIGLIAFVRWKKLSYWFILDVVAPGFFIGQIMGRWGNFFNNELFGPAIQSQWIINLMPSFIRSQMFNNGAYHHPTFLYESFLNLIGLIFLLIIRRKRVFKLGDMLAFYLAWYGLVRIPIEILRIMSGTGEPLGFGGVGITSLSQWYLSISLWTSIILIIVGVAIFVLKRVFIKGLPYYADGDRKAILFDLDGTLLDTQPLINKTFTQVFLEYFPNHKLTKAELDSFFGPTLEQTFTKYTDDKNQIKEMIDTFRKYNRIYHQDGVKAFEHAKETLIELKNRGYLIGIVSSKTEEFIKLGLEQNQMLEMIDVIIGHNHVTNHKPDPEPILLALETLGVTADKAIYVGDHPNDIIAAQAANMTSVGVYYANLIKEVLELNPDYMIDSLDKLLLLY